MLVLRINKYYLTFLYLLTKCVQDCQYFIETQKFPIFPAHEKINLFISNVLLYFVVFNISYAHGWFFSGVGMVMSEFRARVVFPIWVNNFFMISWTRCRSRVRDVVRHVTVRPEGNCEIYLGIRKWRNENVKGHFATWLSISSTSRRVAFFWIIAKRRRIFLVFTLVRLVYVLFHGYQKSGTGMNHFITSANYCNSIP